MEDEKARTAAAAQSARTAQEAFNSLQAQMQAGQWRCVAVEVRLALHEFSGVLVQQTVQGRHRCCPAILPVVATQQAARTAAITVSDV